MLLLLFIVLMVFNILLGVGEVKIFLYIVVLSMFFVINFVCVGLCLLLFLEMSVIFDCFLCFLIIIVLDIILILLFEIVILLSIFFKIVFLFWINFFI